MKNFIVMQEGGQYPSDATGPIRASDANEAAEQYLKDINYGHEFPEPKAFDLVIFEEDSIYGGKYMYQAESELNITVTPE